MIVYGKDINNDGKMDLVVGNYAGGIAIYMGDTGTVSVHESDFASINFSIYPNPSSGAITILIPDLVRNEKIEIRFYNMLGELVYKQTLISSQTKIEKHFVSGIYSCELRPFGISPNAHLNGAKKLVVLK